MSRTAPLWITSFNRKLYEFSGKKFIQTFANSGVKGDLLITHEGMGEKFESEVLLSVPGPVGSKILFYDLDRDTYLQGWLKTNRDIIPRHLGGKAVQCPCPGSENLHPRQKHIRASCHWTWWNRNCSRWFRKIPSIRQAMQMGYRYIVWIDCDCWFTEDAYEFRIANILGGLDGFFLKSPHRKVPECGIVGYDLDSAYAREVIRLVEYKYDSGNFRLLDRWDDSYVWWCCTKIARRQFPHSEFNDLASEVIVRNGHVVESSRIGKYIRHNKGEHARQGLGG